MAFKDRLKMIRSGKDLSQAQLADNLGISPAAIGGYENGTRLPKDNILSRIAEYFGVSEEWLRRGALITDKQRQAIMARFDEPLGWVDPEVGIDPKEVWQALKSRAPLREDRVREIASDIGTRVDDILEDPALMAEDNGLPEDVTQMLQDLYDKDHVLLKSMADTTPEELAQLRTYLEFLKSQR